MGPHSYDAPEAGTVIAYHRDRQEPLEKALVAARWLTVAKKIGHNGYAYVFEDGQWSMYKSGGYGCNKFIPVTPQVEKTV